MARAIGRRGVLLWLGFLCLAVSVGCDEVSPGEGRLETIWGQRGVSPGLLQKPRAIAIDGHDQVYLIDKIARIQVFTTDGQFLRGWRTPEHTNGCPTGVSIDHNGNVLVPDTHYYRVLIYSPAGELLETIGGTQGHGPGEFGWVTDVVEDAEGNLYVSEYGEYDRVQKFGPDHKFILEWGSHGTEPGQFLRPQSLVVDDQGNIWVADACNHRIQVFDGRGTFLTTWGRQGSEPGELTYPYGLELDGDGHVYVCEFGNHRVQKFTRDGVSLGCWGTQGHGPGEMYNPWALARDSHGKIYVLDTNNHRVQKIAM